MPPLKVSPFRQAARPLTLVIILCSCAVSPVLSGNSQAEPRTTQAATLVSGASCFGHNVWCKRPKGLATGDSGPRLYLIDEKGPEIFGQKSGLGGAFNSKWSAKFRVSIAPGPHTLTLSAVQVLGATAVATDKQDVSFTAEAGHLYQVDAVIDNDGWGPVITDITAEGHSHRVVTSP